MKQLKWKAVRETPTYTQERWVVLGLVCSFAKMQREESCLERHSGTPHWEGDQAGGLENFC